MRRLAFLAVVALALVSVLGGSAAYAQDVAIVKMPFAFVVDNKTMPAGTYEFSVNLSDPNLIMMAPQKGASVVMPVITRLAEQGTPSQARIVCDKVGDKYYVSEVWLPSEDGFLVKDTKEPHTHHIIKGETKKKT
jgi:hypothetical protein